VAIDEVGEREQVQEAFGLLDALRLAQELRCRSCGYGIVVRNEPPCCPMCGGGVWERPARSPFRSPD